MASPMEQLYKRWNEQASKVGTHEDSLCLSNSDFDLLKQSLGYSSSGMISIYGPLGYVRVFNKGNSLDNIFNHETLSTAPASAPSCECGAHSIGALGHSSWCPKFEGGN